jgi:hypothetical protein
VEIDGRSWKWNKKEQKLMKVGESRTTQTERDEQTEPTNSGKRATTQYITLGRKSKGRTEQHF